MTARRMIGLFTALLMLHLTLVGADLHCAAHGNQSVAAHQAMGGDHASMVVAMNAVATTDQPCRTPTQPECCRAMTSCAIDASLRGDGAIRQVPPVRQVIEPALMRVPPSPITSPDPPPPKA